MIVSALVVTTNGSMVDLVEHLGQDERIRIGTPDKRFLPLVLMSADLRESRQFFESLGTTEGVDDVQLVGWIDESGITHRSPRHSEAAPSREEP